MPEDYRMERFKRAVLSDAQRERDRLLEAIAAKKKERLSSAEEKILSETFQYIQAQTARIRTKYSRELSRRSMELRRELLKRRADVLDALADNVRRRLEDFTKAPEYRRYFAERLGECERVLGREGLVMTVRSRDVGLAVDEAGRLGLSPEIREDAHILLGGFVLSSGRLWMDETFDRKLADELARFEKTSGLTLG